MKCRTIIVVGVADVPASFKWYQSLLRFAGDDSKSSLLQGNPRLDGTVLPCLHEWRAHETVPKNT
jgi:hypothetical protein